MTSQEILKSFVAHAKEFHVNNSEEVVNNLQRCVHLLGASSDVCQFDPGSKEVVEFFINLHELMLALDPRSNLTWTCLSVLQEACRSQAMRDSLMNTYKFSPILSKILQAQQSRDKRLLVLNLLQELSYGIKISWQESFLKPLMSLLTGFINASDRELSSLSLGVLINLCYKNLPAIYTLMTTVDTKKFLRALLNSQTNDQERMQVCKLLITLESVSGGVPESEMRSYVKLTCPTLLQAVKANNIYLARHIFNYFQEIMNSQKMCDLIDDYEKFSNDVGLLLEALRDENKVSMDCVSIGIEFMGVVVEHVGVNGGVALTSQYPSAVELALRWVRTKGVSVHALNFITRIISCICNNKSMDCGDVNDPSSPESSIFQLIAQQLDVILLLLEQNKEGFFASGTETYAKQSALLKLFTRIIEIPNLADKLAHSLNQQLFHEIFAPLSTLASHEGSNIFEQSIFTFYVQALTFLTALANFDSTWFNLLREKLKEKQINMVLAVALYNGPDKIKRQVLALLTAPAFPAQQLDKLSECLVDMNKLMVYAPSPAGNSPTHHPQLSPMDMNHLLTISQEGYLNSLLDKFEKSLAENNHGVSSGVMELYQYKMAAMSHSMRVMQSSQDAADMRITKLQHCLAMTSAEVSRLHHLLHASEQASELRANNVSTLTSRINDAESEASKWKNKFTQLDQVAKSKTRIIEEQEQELKAAKLKLSSLEEAVSELKLQTSSDSKIIKELKADLETSKKIYTETKKVLESRNELISHMEKEIAVKTDSNQKLTESLQAKEQNVCKLNQQLQMILELAASAKK